MARLDSSYLPRGNPCAQCGKPIPRPDWVESSPGRTSFLWFCRACDYRFEAIAIYEEAQPLFKGELGAVGQLQLVVQRPRHTEQTQSFEFGERGMD